MQLLLWGPEPAPNRAGISPAAILADRLCRLGLPAGVPLVTHRNQQVMLSWSRERGLRLHEGYSAAPDDVLAAMVRFLTPGLRRSARLAARRHFLGFPADQHAPGVRRDPASRIHPADHGALTRLREAHRELNRRHFDGALTEILILLSSRMRRRLGELRLERRTGRPICITLSRRHLRRDGWAGVEATLLHEMVHQWQAETGLPVDHGAAFRRKAREVGITPRATAGEARPATVSSVDTPARETT